MFSSDMFGDSGDVPSTNILVEVVCKLEHLIKGAHVRHVPAANVLVERERLVEAGRHVGDLRRCPVADGLVEIGRVALHEEVIKVRDEAHVPPERREASGVVCNVRARERERTKNAARKDSRVGDAIQRDRLRPCGGRVEHGDGRLEGAFIRELVRHGAR